MEDITSPALVEQNPNCERTICLYGFIRGVPLHKDSSIHISGNTQCFRCKSCKLIRKFIMLFYRVSFHLCNSSDMYQAMEIVKSLILVFFLILVPFLINLRNEVWSKKRNLFTLHFLELVVLFTTRMLFT